jgi:hypothetical protein
MYKFFFFTIFTHILPETQNVNIPQKSKEKKKRNKHLSLINRNKDFFAMPLEVLKLISRTLNCILYKALIF